MNVDLTAFYQISNALAEHYDSMYYVDIETGQFVEFVSSKLISDYKHKNSGKNFFSLTRKIIKDIVHPEDVEKILQIHDKESVLSCLSQKKSYSFPIRLLINKKIVHVRHVLIKCEDKEHVLFCIENIESEYQEKIEQKKTLLSAERMARQDELTGVKNKNAFAEHSKMIDKKIMSGKVNLKFAIVICDINNLKYMNDTRGHSFGDEAIKTTSRMICDVFKHSPVFRIGGDEFVVFLSNQDYENRDSLLQTLKEHSNDNKRTRTGPVVACGMSDYEEDKDKEVIDVFKRADALMYENKNMIKGLLSSAKGAKKIIQNTTPITPERKIILDGLFGSLLTVAGGGYVYLDDMKYDFSRWAISLVNDFGLENVYMYAAEKVWEKYIHPDDLSRYKEIIGKILSGTDEVPSLEYRVRKPDGKYILVTFRGFVLNDIYGNPDYFGGVIIPK
ncbi:MAG: diguanylate cyclase [Treponemataceae bacterium]|nr:diguanylate cyclase [Treponemataceae bacterium]